MLHRTIEISYKTEPIIDYDFVWVLVNVKEVETGYVLMSKEAVFPPTFLGKLFGISLEKRINKSIKRQINKLKICVQYTTEPTP